MKNPQKAAIRYLEHEAAEWVALAEKEMSNPETREIGKLRELMIRECLRTLGLLKRRESQN